MSIKIGFLIPALIMFSIFEVTVAENNPVLLCLGILDKIYEISTSKPISNILSASSKIKI